MYAVDYESQADGIVYVVDYESSGFKYPPGWTMNPKPMKMLYMMTDYESGGCHIYYPDYPSRFDDLLRRYISSRMEWLKQESFVSLTTFLDGYPTTIC